MPRQLTMVAPGHGITLGNSRSPSSRPPLRLRAGSFQWGMAVRFAVLACILLALAACAARNPARVDLCLAALTGLEPGDGGLMIDDIGGAEADVGIVYRKAGEESPSRIQCRFGGGATSIGQLDLQAVTFNGQALGAGRLAFLKTHWLKGAARDAVKNRVARRLEGWFAIDVAAGPYLQSAFSALPITSVYVLLALGFALIHGITGRMNIAHGEFATVGAYAGFAGFVGLGSSSTAAGIAGAAGLALLAAACAGWLTIRAVFIPLARRDGLMLLVASVGMILIYEESMRLTHAARELWVPPLLSDPIALTLPPYVVTVTQMQLAVAVAATVLVAAVFAVLRFSRFGMAWRAVADDALAARFMGINPEQVLGVSAVMAAGLAGAAGLAVLLAFGNANHSMGLMFSFKAMVAALIGGMGSPAGAVLGAVVLAGVETFWVVLFGGAYRDAAVFAMLVALLTLQPHGLFGLAKS